MLDNKISIEFQSLSQNEGFARVAVSAFIAQLDPTIDEMADVKTAVSEAVTNSIIHGYENKKDVYNIKNNAANVGAYSKCRNFVSTNHQ